MSCTSWMCVICVCKMKDYIKHREIDQDLDTLITPIKGTCKLSINQLLTIYQSVHITYFKASGP